MEGNSDEDVGLRVNKQTRCLFAAICTSESGFRSRCVGSSLPSREPGCQIYLPRVCPFQLRDNQPGLILCSNKLIPQLTRQSKVQGRTQIPEGLIESTLALNRFVARAVCLRDAAGHGDKPADSLRCVCEEQRRNCCFFSVLQLASFIFF